ncbi:MAG: deoxyribose-phosphate aldolase [Actinomycetaceae bacterium]|nr:deoxyribose-phosphate aldolase [Actinomycetaceae bacterium]
MNLIQKLTEIRATNPQAIFVAMDNRAPGVFPRGRKMIIIACDHPARGALAAGTDSLAMGSREELLTRCAEALSRPGVDGFLGTADMIEDLTLLGSLENKLVYGSMNRVGLAGAKFEIDDRFASYTPQGIARAHLDGGKTLTRICYDDPNTARTLETTAKILGEMARLHLPTIVEPFISHWQGEKIVNDLTTAAVIRAINIAAGLGDTSAYTWLKLPCVKNMQEVMESTTLPTLILGGEVSPDPDATMERWAKALELPGVRGLIIGRSLLFPKDDDVAKAVDKTVSLL